VKTTRADALPRPASEMRMRVALGSMGYLAEEFAMSGEADSFALGADGGSSAECLSVTASVPYRTRVVVFRPRDPAQFRGTAVVEWLNSRNGADTAPQWLRMHRHIVREGMAWVGVSAQHTGVEGDATGAQRHLKAEDPVRYGHLHHPGDAFSFDIFQQASRLLRQGSLAVPPPKCVLGVGSSQSARFLLTFANALALIAHTFDGFLLTGRHRSAATLQGGSICGGRVAVRGAGRVPVIVLQSETDVFGRMQSHEVRQADTERFRLWEVASAAHADSYVARVADIDDGLTSVAALAAAYAVQPTARLPLAAPMNASPAFHYAHHAALQHLEAWAQAGTQPPVARLLEGEPAHGIARDRLGIALGGVRTPWADCPAMIHSGDNGEPGEFEALFGRTLPLPRGELARLYPGGAADYQAQFASALQRSIAAGFLLEADAPEVLNLARAQFAALCETSGEVGPAA
jgi:hypothetical protein